MDELAREMGFDSEEELHKLVGGADLSTTEKLEAFLKWKNEDGTKDGLLRATVMELSPWIVVDDYCATRVIKGTNPEEVANRVAFIEKTPRVRNASFTTWDEEQGKWPQGPKGSGGSEPEKNGYYGFDEESREWCDKELKKLGYIL